MKKRSLPFRPSSGICLLMLVLSPQRTIAYALSGVSKRCGGGGVYSSSRINNEACRARVSVSRMRVSISMLPQRDPIDIGIDPDSAPFPLYPNDSSWSTFPSTYLMSSLVEVEPRATKNPRALLDSLTSTAVSIHSNTRVGLKNSVLDSDGRGAFLHQSSRMSMARFSSTSSALNTSKRSRSNPPKGQPPVIKVSSIQIDLTEEEKELFDLLRTVTAECGMKSTLRVAGGWVRDKILASEGFRKSRVRGKYNGSGASECSHFEEEVEVINSNFYALRSKAGNKANAPSSSSSSDKSLSVTVPVDIDIALDDKLGREFADELNSWLSAHGRETHSVGVVMKNPEKSKHLETATMRVNNHWIDFVNLRAEEYSSDSRIPDLMRIGTAEEDALRRDLTINSLFYNINQGIVEDMTGRGLDDLSRGIVATPLPPLTTLLDDPLRVLRSVRFAARLRFGMADSLRKAAADDRVKLALEQKVSRERVGSEIDLMLKSRDPVRAMRLLVNLGLIETVFPVPLEKKLAVDDNEGPFSAVFHDGLALIGTTHDHLCDCKANPPMWCEAKRAFEAGLVNGARKEETRPLMDDEDARRLLWYAAFLKPLRDRTTSPDDDNEPKKKSRKANRSVILKLLVDEMKLPIREAESVEKIMKAADEFTKLVSTGNISAVPILLSKARVVNAKGDTICAMDNRTIDPDTEDDPVWKHSMEFRENCAVILRKIDHLWRAAFVLSMCEQLMSWENHEIEELIGDVVPVAPEEVVTDIMHNYDVFAAAMMQLGLIGIWNQEPMVNGDEIKKSVLPNIPKGPIFRDVMDAQTQWITTHPGGSREKLTEHLRCLFPDFQ